MVGTKLFFFVLVILVVPGTTLVLSRHVRPTSADFFRSLRLSIRILTFPIQIAKLEVGDGNVHREE